jgi:hypothetical protein
LPEIVREALNRRRRDGKKGTELPEVRTVPAAPFEGRAINERNLTDWKQGGYEDWRRKTEGRELMEEIVAQTKDLENVSGDECGRIGRWRRQRGW